MGPLQTLADLVIDQAELDLFVKRAQAHFPGMTTSASPDLCLPAFVAALPGAAGDTISVEALDMAPRRDGFDFEELALQAALAARGGAATQDGALNARWVDCDQEASAVADDLLDVDGDLCVGWSGPDTLEWPGALVIVRHPHAPLKMIALVFLKFPCVGRDLFTDVQRRLGHPHEPPRATSRQPSLF
jgi:hypothetical protein